MFEWIVKQPYSKKGSLTLAHTALVEVQDCLFWRHFCRPAQPPEVYRGLAAMNRAFSQEAAKESTTKETEKQAKHESKRQTSIKQAKHNI